MSKDTRSRFKLLIDFSADVSAGKTPAVKLTLAEKRYIVGRALSNLGLARARMAESSVGETLMNIMLYADSSLHKLEVLSLIRLASLNMSISFSEASMHDDRVKAFAMKYRDELRKTV